MAILELPDRFLEKTKPELNLAGIDLDKKKDISLFKVYSAKDESVLELPNRFEKNDLNIDFEDNSSRLYDKEQTDFFNDIQYGWNQSQAGFYHLLENVPGGLDAIKDFVGKAPGLGFLNGDGHLAGMESWLRERAEATTPENLGLDAPDTLAGKILAGFAMTPITIATYVAPIRILKSVPMGMALVDGIREADEGLLKAGIAAGKGAVMGKLIEASNVLRLPERMGALGVLGFTTAGGNLEDRIAGGVVFGSLGVIGPGKGKTLTEVKRDVTGENVSIRKASEDRVKEWGIYNEKLGEAIKLTNIQEAKIEKYQKTKNPRKKVLESYKKELDKHLNREKKYVDAMHSIERVLHTNDKLAKGIKGKDNRPAMQVVADLFDRTGAKKYIDLEKITHKFSGMVLPMKFITKNPITKWTADFMSDIRIGIENKVETILHDPRLTPRKLGEFKLDKELLKQGRIRDSIRFGGLSALRYIRKESSDGAALTRAKELYKTDWRKLEDVIHKAFKIEIDKKAQAKKAKTKIEEVTDVELKTKYKLDKKQIEVYKDLRNGLDKVHEFYNEYVNKYVKTIPGAKARKIAAQLPYMPNYMPHMFLGDFRVWVNKKSDTSFKNPVYVAPVNSRWSANFTAKDLAKKFSPSKYNITIKAVESKNISNKGITAFEEAVQYAERMGKSDVAKEMHAIYSKSISTRGFRKHSIKRKNIPGQAGTKEGLEGVLHFLDGYGIYVRGAVQKAYSFKARKETNHVLQNRKVMKDYANARNLAMKYRENALGGEGNRITQALQNATRKWLGESGAINALGNLNKFTLTWKLMFGNLRFMAAQYIQPFQMIPAKLMNLQSEGMRGDMWRSMIEAQRSLIMPDKATRRFIEHMVNERVIEPKFLQEFAREAEFTALGKFSVGKNFVVDMPKFIETISMKNIAGKVESYSRMNAGLMFYHFAKRSGKSEKEAMDFASYNADKYMVEYNSFERPLIYSDAGLGAAGKPFGLFKTFQHNYFAQLTEHIQAIKWGKLKKGEFESAKGFVTFTTTMIATAGALNIIGIEIADRLINKIAPVWERLFGERPQNVTEMLLRSDLPDWVKWGAPSAGLDADLTTTLAAPGLGLQDLVSVPSLEMLGLHPGQLAVPLFKRRKGGVLQTSTNWAFKSSMGMATYADAQMFYESIAPTSMKGIVEATYSTPSEEGFYPIAGTKRIGKGLLRFWTGDESMYGGTLVKDPWKKSRGEVRRDLKDWRKRLYSSYSLKEANALKTIYALTTMDRNASLNQESVVAMAAELVLDGEEIPNFLFELSLAHNVSPKTFRTQIKNRIKLMNTSLLDKELKKKNLARKSETFDLIMPLIDAESAQKTKPDSLQLPDKFEKTTENILKLPDRFQISANWTDNSFMNALAMAESGGNPTAVSWRGAQGLFQIMPATARKPGFNVKPLSNPFDPTENARFAKEYMNVFMRKYNGNKLYALVAWNWGPSNADKWIEGGANFDKLPSETKRLVKKMSGVMEA